MSSRPQLSPYAIIEDGDMSADITSQIIVIQKLSMISFDVSWDGATPIGTMVVEVSNSYSQNQDGSVKDAGFWNELPLSEDPDVSGNTDNGFIDVLVQAGYAIRVRYSRTSGTGTMQVIANAKVS